jgi:hypothetical protein
MHCESCGRHEHNYATGEALACVPPRHVLQFGPHRLDAAYRQALYERFPFYTAEEIIGSFLGENPYWPSQETWLAPDEELSHSSSSDSSLSVSVSFDSNSSMDE